MAVFHRSFIPVLCLASLLFNSARCRRSCYDEHRNEIVDHGGTIVNQTSLCHFCRCTDGMFSCRSIKCQPVFCLDAVLLSHKCCPVCAGDLPTNNHSPLFTKLLLVDCTDGRISVSIKKEYATGDAASDIAFNDRQCVAKERNGRYILDTRVDECGTEVLDLPEAIVYKNRARSRFVLNSIITRRVLVDFEVACIYSKTNDRVKPIRIRLRPPASLTQRVIGRGNIGTSLELLDSQLRVISVTAKVLEITPGGTVYFRVRSHGAKQTNMQVNTKRCTVGLEKKGNNLSFYHYGLIEEGCIIEPTVKRVKDPIEDGETFSFQVLTPIQPLKLRLVLQCDTVLCMRSEKRCLREC